MHLSVIENCNRLSCFDVVTFSETNFKNPAAYLWSYCGIVAFDSAGKGKYVFGSPVCEECTPYQDCAAGERHKNDEHNQASGKPSVRHKGMLQKTGLCTLTAICPDNRKSESEFH